MDGYSTRNALFWHRNVGRTISIIGSTDWIIESFDPETKILILERYALYFPEIIVRSQNDWQHYETSEPFTFVE